jgi:hypothetical protein
MREDRVRNPADGLRPPQAPAPASSGCYSIARTGNAGLHRMEPREQLDKCAAREAAKKRCSFVSVLVESSLHRLDRDSAGSQRRSARMYRTIDTIPMIRPYTTGIPKSSVTIIPASLLRRWRAVSGSSVSSCLIRYHCDTRHARSQRRSSLRPGQAHARRSSFEGKGARERRERAKAREGKAKNKAKA